MAHKKTGNQQQTQAHTNPQAPSSQAIGAPIPPLVERGEAQAVSYKPEYEHGVPKNRFLRWLWSYSQVVLSALTLAVIIISLVQWMEYRNTRELENRAYVLCKGVQLAPATVPSMNDVLVACVNAGRTPGRNGSIFTQLERRAASPPEDTVINRPEKRLSRILFGPQIEIYERAGRMNIVQPPGVNVAEAPRGSQGPSIRSPSPQPTPAPAPQDLDRFWYVYGVVIYEDIFGRPHRTKFCFENQPLTASWAYCPTFNDAD